MKVNVVYITYLFVFFFFLHPVRPHWLSREKGADIHHLSASARLCGSVQSGLHTVGTADRQGDRQRGAMAADGGCGESVDQYRAELERLTQELAEANREKIRAAECGLVVLEENQSLKQKYLDLEIEQETLRKELEQLQEVGGPASAAVLTLLTRRTHCSVCLCGQLHHFSPLNASRSEGLFVELMCTQAAGICGHTEKSQIGEREPAGAE